MRDRKKISTFHIDDEDVAVILYPRVEGDPSSIGRPAGRARESAQVCQLHRMIALAAVQANLRCAGAV
jgi:hypothetical protein